MDQANNSFGAEEIEHRFGFHKATIEGENATLPIHTSLRLRFRELAEYLDELVPAGRTKSVAFTELETASMWFHKAIAETAPLVEDVVDETQERIDRLRSELTRPSTNS